MKCEHLDIEMPIGKKCPSKYNFDNSICYSGCGFAELVKIEIKSRFDTLDFKDEIMKTLKENGFVKYREGEQTPMGFKVGGFEIKKPFTIYIEENEIDTPQR